LTTPGQPPPPVTTYEAIRGQVLREVRNARGLGQGEMARRAGVTQPYWSKVEQGQANPSDAVLRRASEQLGLRYSDLIARTEDVCEAARSRGVNVVNRDESPEMEWRPWLAAAAIGALVAIVLTKGGGE